MPETILCLHSEVCVVQMFSFPYLYCKSFQVCTEINMNIYICYNECQYLPPGLNHYQDPADLALPVLCIEMHFSPEWFKQVSAMSFVNLLAFSKAVSSHWFERYPFHDYKTMRQTFAQNSPRSFWINFTWSLDLLFFFNTHSQEPTDVLWSGFVCCHLFSAAFSELTIISRFVHLHLFHKRYFFIVRFVFLMRLSVETGLNYLI